MGSASCYKGFNKNKDDNDVADIEDSEPKSSPTSVSKNHLLMDLILGN